MFSKGKSIETNGTGGGDRDNGGNRGGNFFFFFGWGYFLGRTKMF